VDALRASQHAMHCPVPPVDTSLQRTSCAHIATTRFALSQGPSTSLKSPGQSHLKCAAAAAGPCLTLHRAAAAGNAPLVKQLLEAGTDPTVADRGGKTAYEVALSKDVRDTMRRYMAAEPAKWDYARARIPSGLTEEMEQAQVRHWA
jgi:hypothetical protein